MPLTQALLVPAGPAGYPRGLGGTDRTHSKPSPAQPSPLVSSQRGMQPILFPEPKERPAVGTRAGALARASLSALRPAPRKAGGAGAGAG